MRVEDSSGFEQLPPHNIEAEQAFVGSLLLDRDAIAEVADWVLPEAFYHGANGIIFQAIRALWKVRRPTDLVTLTDLLISRNMMESAGGYAYLSSLFSATPTAVHVRYYGEIVMEHARRRALIEAGAGIVQAAYAGEVAVDDLVSQLRRADERFAAISAAEPNTFADGMDPTRNRALERWAGQLSERIVPSGIAAIDAKTYGGFKGGELVYIGGRPGSGKTAIAMQMAMHGARHGKHALIVELEMTREALFNRAIASYAGVPFSVPYQTVGDVLERDRWLSASEHLESLPVTVETRLITTDQIAGFCDRAALDRPVDIIFIDHLDHLADPDLSRETVEQRTAKTSRRLKRIAMDRNIPVVVLSQLNRAVEEHPPYKPSLNHFRYSGAVEQDADFAFLLWRRKYYVDKGDLESDPNEDFIVGSNRHKVELMMAKHRNGDVGPIYLAWEPSSMTFHERTAA